VRRPHIHIVFGTTTVTLALMAGYCAMQLRQAARVNMAIANADARLTFADAPEALLARANALAKANLEDAATHVYKDLIQRPRADLHRLALFNLGNLYLRSAIQKSPDDPIHLLPLVELAKQSYRSLLREDPADWDARFNLERALWVAPEFDEAASVDDTSPVPKERAISTLQGARMDLP
jgi:mxaK protein